MFLKCESENHPSGHAGIFLNYVIERKCIQHFATLWLDEEANKKKRFFFSSPFIENQPSASGIPCLPFYLADPIIHQDPNLMLSPL